MVICTDDYFTDDGGVLRLADAARIREVDSVGVQSQTDGETKRVSGLFTMMEAYSSWRNPTGVTQNVMLRLRMGPRSIITSNPNELGLRDWLGIDTAERPRVQELPHALGGTYGRIRSNAWSAQSVYGKLFYDFPSRELWIPCGTADPGQSTLVRYRATLKTLAPWREPAEKLFVAKVYWARLQLWASPLIPGGPQ